MNAEISHYLALKPLQYPQLERLAAQGLGSAAEVQMVFRGSGAERLVVHCAGVRDLSFRQPHTSDMKLHSLDVRDISKSQLEDLHFEVTDLEQESVSFRCLTFDARLDVD